MVVTRSSWSRLAATQVDKVTCSAGTLPLLRFLTSHHAGCQWTAVRRRNIPDLCSIISTIFSAGHTVLVYTPYDIPPCWMQVAGLFTHIYHTHYDYWLFRTARNSLHYVTHSAIFLNGSNSLLRTNNAASYIPYLLYIYIYYSLFCQLLVLIGFLLTLSL